MLTDWKEVFDTRFAGSFTWDDVPLKPAEVAVDPGSAGGCPSETLT
jgi:hypothetical protein